MEWKKLIGALAALMLAYSLVGCASNSTATSEAVDEAVEVTTTEESEQKQNGIYEFSYDYMVDFGLYGKASILTDKETGVEYIIIDTGESGIAITPRLKGDTCD